MSDVQAKCWSGKKLSRYRAPTHPVVAAYVRSKLHYLGRHMTLRPDTTLLDVGCGNGFFTHQFAQVCRVTGIDVSHTMLKMNRHQQCAQMDASHLGFSDKSFDIAFCHALLHHVDDIGVVVREMARVARNYVVFLEPNRDNPLMFLTGALEPSEHRALRFSRRYMCRQVSACGVDIVAAFSQGMIAENRTPKSLLPLCEKIDFVQPFGMTHIVIGRPCG